MTHLTLKQNPGLGIWEIWAKLSEPPPKCKTYDPSVEWTMLSVAGKDSTEKGCCVGVMGKQPALFCACVPSWLDYEVESHGDTNCPIYGKQVGLFVSKLTQAGFFFSAIGFSQKKKSEAPCEGTMMVFNMRKARWSNQWLMMNLPYFVFLIKV